MDHSTVTTGARAGDALAAAYAELEPTPRRVYRILGTLPVPVLDADLAAAACALPWAEADWTLQILDEEQLVERVGHLAGDEDRLPLYRFGEAALAHAAVLSHGEEVVALDRLAVWILVCARAVQRELAPHQEQPTLPPPGAHPGGAGLEFPFRPTDHAAMLEWLEHQGTNNLLPLLTALGERGRSDLIWRTVDGWWPLFQRRRPHSLWVGVHRVGLVAARADGDRAGERRMLLSGAIGLLDAGQHGEAAEWNTAAVEGARAERDVRDEGQALHGLALGCLAEQRPEDATALVAQAMARWESCGYRRGEALAQITLAQCVMNDRPQQAIDLLTCARTTLRDESGPDHHLIRALAIRGHAHLLAGDPAAAAGDLKRARDEFPEDDTSPWPARTQTLLTQARTVQQEHPTARAAATPSRTAPTDRSGPADDRLHQHDHQNPGGRSAPA
ncbi:hypothetical protein GCM10010232_49050 [Streptomyces amakusaensis]|uniref:Tetratricopeptide repeat protein n=1 Tax=Streptomyces amakusaensis TaxID=67271 RepID=A0ABW0ANM7_9ACTN